MNLSVYRILTHLGLPLFAYASWKRCKKYQSARQTNPDLPEIKACTRSRFGLNPNKFQTGGILIHAVSVGETRSVFELLTKLNQAYPQLPITLTNSSLQGAVHAQQFAPVPFQQQLLPFDYPFAVNRFLEQIKPKVVVMVETEIWPNLYKACEQRGIPVLLINARLKQASFESYKKWGGSMIKQSLCSAQLVAAQTIEDAERFEKLSEYQANIEVFGNLKSDIQITPELLEQAQNWHTKNQEQRPIWVAASTHANPGNKKDSYQSEEALLLEAHKQLLKTEPNALLILVPRHQARFDKVDKLLKESGLNYQRRSLDKTEEQTLTNSSNSANAINADTQVYLADTLGEMMLWYAIADIAFVGGSLVPFGGHNILEPAAFNRPIISGPHYDNLADMFAPFSKAQAVQICQNPNELAQQLSQLINNPEQAQALANKAHQCFNQQSGALEKTFNAIKTYLE